MGQTARSIRETINISVLCLNRYGESGNWVLFGGIS